MENSKKSFSSLPLPTAMVENLKNSGYTHMTEIQSLSLQPILDQHDIIAQAKTGSGKTAAFGIGLLSHLDVKKFRVQSLVLCPTRELAHQVAKELRNLAKFQHNIKILTLIGGESFGKQIGSLAHHAHIVVGTPGRVLKHLNKNTLSLSELQCFVLDEADRMLDMGFIEEIDAIVEHFSHKPQTLLFSATFEPSVLEISKKYQSNPLKIMIKQEKKREDIDEVFVASDTKQTALIGVLSHFQPENSIVFVNTKVEADEIASYLQKHQIDALAIHGDLEQYERTDVLVQFVNGSCRVLIATDVAARGLDIKELAMVVNYDIPNTAEIYTHRIGRTARAGAQGVAVTLYENEESLEGIATITKSLSYTELESDENFTMLSNYTTLVIEGGKKDKLRPGDILGALTADKELQGDDIGKIEIYDKNAYVAIKTKFIDQAHKKLNNGKIKAKKFSVWILE